MGAEITRLWSSTEQQGPQVAVMKGVLAEAVRERFEKAAVVEKLQASLQSERFQREPAEKTAEATGGITATRLELIRQLRKEKEGMTCFPFPLPFHSLSFSRPG